ncbi:hypothetical protein GCM10027085_22660 [Spirosoma aerophilum]
MVSFAIFRAGTLETTVAVPKHAATLPTKTPIPLILRIVTYVMGQHKIKANGLVAVPAGAYPLIRLVTVPKQTGTLFTEAPMLLVLPIFIYIMCQGKIKANGFVSSAIGGTGTFKATITIPKQATTLSTKAPV